MSVNSGLKATKIIVQMKAFYRQRIPEFSCARKKTIDINILVTSRNGHRKIKQSIRFKFRSQFKLLPQIRWPITLRIESSIISIDSNIVKEGNYYANSKNFVLPSSLFMLELRARCHSQLKMVPKKLRQIF